MTAHSKISLRIQVDLSQPWFHAEQRLPGYNSDQLIAVYHWLPEEERDDFFHAVEFEFETKLCAVTTGALSHLSRLIRRPEDWAGANLKNNRKWVVARIKAFLEEREALADAKTITDAMGAV